MFTKNMLAALIFAASACAAQAHPEQSSIEKPATSGKTITLTAGAGTLTGAATYWALSALFDFWQTDHINLSATIGGLFRVGPVQFAASVGKAFKTPANYLIGAATISTAALASWLAYRYQPEGKFDRAHNELKKVLVDEILNDLLQAQIELIENIDSAYVHHAYPRVAAFNNFVDYHKKLTDAVKLLQEASQAGSDEVKKAVRVCQRQLQNYILEIEKCIQIIRNSPDWIKYLKGHDAMLARQAQERCCISCSTNSF